MALTRIKGSNIADGTVEEADIADNSVTATKLDATLDLSSKSVTLASGAITPHVTDPTKSSIEALGIDVPATNLTGVKTVGGVSIAGSGDIPVDTVTKSASDPAVDTNGAVGDQWVNTTSGEMFVCTDATTGANVWKNQAGGEDVFPNAAPTNPTNTSSFPSIIGDDPSTFTFTFSGAADSDAGDSVTHYKVDNFTGGKISCTTTEVVAGSAHTFSVTSTAADTAVSFRVRAKDSNGAYSTGVTINSTVKNSTTATYDIFGDGSAVAQWRFDNSSSDNGGSYNMSWNGGSSYNSSGKFSQAANMTGSNYLHNGSLNHGNTWSYSIWMKGSGTIIFNKVNGSYGHRTCQIESGRLKIYNGSSDYYLNWTAPSTSSWHHLVVTKTGSSCVAYIDGTQVASSSLTTTNGGNSGVFIGCQSNVDSGVSPVSFFNGQLDQIRCFNKALNSTEVTTLYNEV